MRREQPVNHESYFGWGVALIGAACLLVFVEVFIPSGGLIAVASAAAACAGIVMLFLHNPMSGIIGLLATMILGPMAIAFAFRMFPHTPIGRRMILGARPSDPTEGVTHQETLHAMIGAEGDAITDLRPVGVVRIDGERHDALAEGPMIEAGSRVRVVIVEANQIKVRKID